MATIDKTLILDAIQEGLDLLADSEEPCLLMDENPLSGWGKSDGALWLSLEDSMGLVHTIKITVEEIPPWKEDKDEEDIL